MSFDIFIFYTFSHGLFSFRLQPFNQLHRSFSAGWDVEKPATRPHFSTRVQKYTSTAASVSQQSPHPFFTKNQLSLVNPTYTWGPTKYTMSIFGNFQILRFSWYVFLPKNRVVQCTTQAISSSIVRTVCVCLCVCVCVCVCACVCECVYVC